MLLPWQRVANQSGSRGVTLCIVATVVPSFFVFLTIESKHTHPGRFECTVLLLSMKSGSFSLELPQI